MRVAAVDCVTRGWVTRTPARSSQHRAAVPSPRVSLQQRRVSLPLRSCLSRALHRSVAAAAEVEEEDDEPFEVDLQVTGMKCEGCVDGVTAALKAAPAVVRVIGVDLASGIATCEVKAETMVRVTARGTNSVWGVLTPCAPPQFDAAALTPVLVDAVKKAGFACTPLL